MGMYDDVWVPCPSCSKDVRFQSKAGECRLRNFGITTAPLEVLADIKGSKNARQCSCGALVRVVLSFRAWAELVGQSSPDFERIEGREDDSSS